MDRALTLARLHPGEPEGIAALAWVAGMTSMANGDNIAESVDAAEDRAKVKAQVKKEGITWRSFWAGGPDGALLRMWCVEQWPTVYTIDADGIIRDDQVGEQPTPAAFEPLVQAAEKAAR